MNGQVKLNELVSRAIERMAQDGISGWGLNNPDEALFDSVITEGASGCKSETCNHVSHDPATEMVKLILLVPGKIVCLGDEQGENEEITRWYAIVTAETTRFFEVREPRFYWATIREIDGSKVPEWALAQMAHA